MHVSSPTRAHGSVQMQGNRRTARKLPMPEPNLSFLPFLAIQNRWRVEKTCQDQSPKHPLARLEDVNQASSRGRVPLLS